MYTEGVTWLEPAFLYAVLDSCSIQDSSPLVHRGKQGAGGGVSGSLRSHVEKAHMLMTLTAESLH